MIETLNAWQQGMAINGTMSAEQRIFLRVFQFWSFNIVSNFVFRISSLCVHNVLASSASDELPEATASEGASLPLNIVAGNG